ncbi:reticulon-4-interacting protein 1, mitochondrial-like [Epargyreus clarus]|uniref:reticulon-4-interacting protein 1, mitochondrial-like n=1 Tax=Epargyreus clarus TaxID=520877 RepID=UPI003C2CF61E
MDELKKAGEKLEALHEAARVAADTGRTRFQDVYNQTSEAIFRIRTAIQELWQHELIAESRARIAAFAHNTVQRVREGAPPLSPVLLYEELVELFKDRVWRRSVFIFACGAAVGGSAGVLVGLRLAARGPTGPHARALHAQPDQAVILVEDAVSPGAGSGEVLVRVQAFSVCAADRSVLRGRASALRSLITRTPVTVGRGFAGVVLDVGPGVTELELGDEVWGCLSEWSGGAAGELLALRSSRVSKRPARLAADTAAALPWGGAVALAALDRLQLSPDTCKGKRVAVIGAESGEGCALVQLLSSWGARITAAAPRNASRTLRDLGAQEFIFMEGSNDHVSPSWLTVEQHGARTGLWDAALCCPAAGAPVTPLPSPSTILKATASRSALLDLRPRALLTDRMVQPFWLLFCATFYSWRLLRWVVGCGSHTDWLEDPHLLAGGLAELRSLVETGQIAPVLDKVYLPQDFEAALAHACSEDAVGTTVIRFP